MYLFAELLAALGKLIIKRMPTKKPNLTWKPAAPQNYTEGRKGEKIEYVVIHTMQGSQKGCAAWFADPKAQCSAHYSVGFNGEIIQHVSDQNTAWHAGHQLYNRRSIGIELEGFCERGYFPDTMMTALADLVKYLAKEYNIEISRQRIIGHNEVPSPDGKGFGGLQHHTDPGDKFPWGVFMELLKDEPKGVA